MKREFDNWPEAFTYLAGQMRDEAERSRALSLKVSVLEELLCRTGVLTREGLAHLTEDIAKSLDGEGKHVAARSLRDQQLGGPQTAEVLPFPGRD